MLQRARNHPKNGPAKEQCTSNKTGPEKRCTFPVSKSHGDGKENRRQGQSNRQIEAVRNLRLYNPPGTRHPDTDSGTQNYASNDKAKNVENERTPRPAQER